MMMCTGAEWTNSNHRNKGEAEKSTQRNTWCGWKQTKSPR